MLKKFLFLLIFCICLSFNTYADGERNIRVGIYYGSGAKQSVEINIDGEIKTVTADDVDESVEYYPEEVLKIDGVECGGYVTLVKSHDLLTVINTVDLEDYLCSVVGKEMSPSFEIEALKAQAVAARTYVLKKLGKHSDNGFDVCASVHCQAYGGVASHNDKITEAVMATKGQALYYNDRLIDAVYSATSGGYTESAVNVWGTDHPYLVAVSDEYEEETVHGHKWEGELTAERATEIMKNCGYDVGYVTDIRIDKKSEHGAVTKLTVVGTDGEKTFKNESCRNIFSSVTLSQAYDITPVSDASTLYTTSGVVDKASLFLLSFEEVLNQSVNDLYLLSADGVYKKTSSENTAYKFSGRGYGHLVGMSQNGANGMAKNGFTYDEILLHYYQGAELQ